MLSGLFIVVFVVATGDGGGGVCMCVCVPFFGGQSRETKSHQVLVIWLSLWVRPILKSFQLLKQKFRFLDVCFTWSIPNWYSESV